MSRHLVIPTAAELDEVLQDPEAQDPFAYFYCAQFEENCAEGDELGGF